MAESTSWLECRKCGQYKRLKAFYIGSKGKPGPDCRRCLSKTYNRRYYANRDFIVEYKLARGCADCGFNGHPSALEFDHLPQFEKHEAISRLVLGNRGPLEAEIAKCEVVCANCHRIRTAERRQEHSYWDAYHDALEADEVAPFEQLGFEFPAA